MSNFYVILPKSKEIGCNLRTRWEQSIPANFPNQSAFHFLGTSGPAIYGHVTFSKRGAALSAHTPLSIHELNTLLSDPDDERIAMHTRLKFPLAIWNSRANTLVIARDPIGQAEVFHLETPELHIFSSSLAVLLSDRKIRKNLSISSAANYLILGRPLSGQTLAAGIRKLPAGHVVECRKYALPVYRRYYSTIRQGVSKVLSDLEKIDLVNQLDKAILASRSVGKQSILASGGVDSSYILSSLALQGEASDVEAYTVDFCSPYAENETDYARFICNYFQVKLNVVQFGFDEANENFRRVLELAEPASAWASMTHLGLVQQMTSDGNTSFISGLGADEVFGGYSRFLKMYRIQRQLEERWPKHNGQDFIDSLIFDSRQAVSVLFSGVPEFLTLAELRRYGEGAVAHFSNYLETASFYLECRALKPDAHLFEIMTAHECNYRIPDLLFSSFDAATLEFNMDARYPFLSPPVIEMACGLGASEKFWLKDERWSNKKLLKELAALRIPREIIERPIGSYTTPMAMWLSEKRFRSLFRELLMDATIWSSPIVSRDFRLRIEEIIFGASESRRIRESAVYKAWVLVTLAGWCEKWGVTS